MRLWIVCVAAAAIVAFGVRASTEAPQTFRTATRLVEVSVVVTTNDGTPVKGLTQADFTIQEERKPQTISFFEARDDNTPLAPRTESPFTIPTAPNTFTNAQRSPTGTSTVLLLDRLNSAWDSQYEGKRHLDRFLASMPPGDRVALYALDDQLVMLHDFTGDTKALRATLDAFDARMNHQYEASTDAPPATAGAWLHDPNAAMSEFFTQRRLIYTWEMLELLAQNLVGVPGRKNLVWVSDGFAMPTGLSRPWFMEMMARANRALSSAQVSVYPVDSRGLVPAYQAVASRAQTTIMWNNHFRVRGNIETMEHVADQTGGRAYANTNGLATSIGRAVNHARTSYLLGYYPASTPTGTGFRSISVKVNRGGVVVRHRLGYFAEPSSGDKETSASALRNALESTLQSSAVGVAATATRQAERMTLEIRIDPATLGMARKNDRWEASVEVLIAQVDRRGRGRVEERFPLVISLSDEERTRMLTEGIAVARTISPKAETADIRILVHDIGTAKVGSLLIPLSRVR